MYYANINQSNEEADEYIRCFFGNFYLIGIIIERKPLSLWGCISEHVYL